MTRTRALRDKYRDVYRRQTVATQTGPAKARKQMGGENDRTAVKAEIMQQVLSRFETQQAKVDARLEKEAARKTPKAPRRHNAPGAPATRTTPKSARRSRRTAGDAPPSGDADKAMRGATATQQRQIARRDRAAEDLGYEVVSARGAKSSRAGGSSVRPAVKAPASKKTGARQAITAAAQPAAKLVKQVRQAVARKSGADVAEGTPTARRGIRAKVGGSPTANAQDAVPVNMPAVAQRYNPLKAEPVNKKMHASQRGQKKVFEAKRSGR